MQVITKSNNTEYICEPQASLPRSIIVGALKYADKVEGTEHMISHDDVMGEIYRRRGWK